MKKILFPLLLLLPVLLNAQQFIGTGKIEYEVKANIHKILGDDAWANLLKDRIPQFSTSYYQYTFNEDKSVYKFDRYDSKGKPPLFLLSNIEDNTWFNDYAAQTFTQQKYILDNTYLMSGALMNISWKLSPTETREIAGFNCRKATGIIFDSVYVFAFYTEEIMSSGGPMGLHGLPGMIMGITIPRMYTSWIASKVEVNGVDTRKIIAPAGGRKRDPVELKETVQKATKDWGRSYVQQAIWGMFL